MSSGGTHGRGRPVAHALAWTGRILIAAGVLLLLFVAFELWGTNVHESGAQKDLGRQFRHQVASTTTTTPTPSTSADGSTVRLPARAAATTAAPAPGEPIGLMDIPKLHVHKYVVEGVSDEDLRKGPGHYPGTPLPGQKGNSAIAGHRTTYGAPFADIDKLAKGDLVKIQTRQGRFTYQVFNTLIVSPSDVSVLNDFGDNRLTLTACHPRYGATSRIIIQAKLVGQPVPGLPGQSEAPVLHASLGGADSPWGVLIGWGLLCSAIWAATYALSRWLRARGWDWRRWAPYLVGAPLFFLVLFVFFQSVSALLPANF